MMAAQLLAAHNAAMECYRRAMLGEQTFEGRRETLNQANKLSRTYATLLEALNRHRGKGQQKVTVEHVHVHAGGQAMVGVVERPGGGDRSKSEEQPHAKQIAHAPEPALRSPDAERDAVPVARDDERPLPDARRNSPGAPIGNANARKHGLYTAERHRRAAGAVGASTAPAPGSPQATVLCWTNLSSTCRSASPRSRLAGCPRRWCTAIFIPANFADGSRSLVLLDFADSIVGHPLLDMAAFLTRVPEASRAGCAGKMVRRLASRHSQLRSRMSRPLARANCGCTTGGNLSGVS